MPHFLLAKDPVGNIDHKGTHAEHTRIKLHDRVLTETLLIIAQYSVVVRHKNTGIKQHEFIN